MENSSVNSVLDQNLPKELRGSVEFLGPTKKGEIEGGAIESAPQSEETNMSTTQTTPALSNEQVRAIASEEAGKLLGQANSQIAIASAIEKHLTVANLAQAEAVKAKAELEIVQKALEESKAAAKKATDEVVTAKEATEKAKKEHGEKDETQKKATAAMQVELATAKKKLAEFDAKDKKAKREKAIADGKIKSAKFAGRATASNEDGSLKMSDEEFDAAVEEFKETIGGGTETPNPEQATASPIPAPKDGDGPAGKQGSPKGTPVAAPKTDTGPAAGQKGSGFTKAKADEAGTTTTDTTQATASVPAEPQIPSQQDMFAHASAALAASSHVTQPGKSKYASAFKAN